MKIIIMGGDTRFVRLYRLLEEDGHSVFPLGLDREKPMQGPPDFAGADVVILPLPVERDGYLNAPLCGQKLCTRELLGHLRPGTRVFGGMAGESLRSFCGEKGLRLFDYFAREELQVKNAALTAEGAIALMLGMAERGLLHRRVLISGFGRIGRLLAPRLRGMGAEVCVAARSPADRAWAQAMGCRALTIPDATSEEFDFVLNTVPATIFASAEIAAFGDAELIELASAPYGFDLAAAAEMGKSVTLAPGLPAKAAPQAAAEAIRDTIYNMLEE